METIDPYQRAIDYLTENQSRIQSNWDSPHTTIGGILFRYASPSGEHLIGECGCLTQIGRLAGRYAFKSDSMIDFALTREIADDHRIPDTHSITAADLPVFAEWQRKLDARWPGRLERWMKAYEENLSAAEV